MQNQDLRRLLRAFNPWWKNLGEGPWRAREADDPHTQAVMDRLFEVSSTIDTLISGPRLSGKTALLDRLIQRLLGGGHPAANLCFCDLTLPALRGASLRAIVDTWLESAPVTPTAAMRLLLDGVDHLRDWQDQFRDLSGHGCLITATALADSGSGPRADTIQVPWKSFHLVPLHFREFLAVTGHQAARAILGVSFEELLEMDAGHLAEVSELLEPGLQEAFLDYITRGLFPGPALAPDRASGQRQILERFLARILREDLPGRHHARQPALLEELVTHLAGRGDSVLHLGQAAADLGIPGRQSIENFANLLVESGLYHRIAAAGPSDSGNRGRHKLLTAHPAIHLAHLLAGRDCVDDPRLMGPALESAARLHLARHYGEVTMTHHPLRATDPRGSSADLVIDTPRGRLAIEVIAGGSPPAPARLRRFGRFLGQKPTARGVVLTQSPGACRIIDPANPEIGPLPRSHPGAVTILPAALACLALSKSHESDGKIERNGSDSSGGELA